MVYNYTTTFPFERDFDLVPTFEWMKENWTYSLLLSFFYVVSINVGTRLMSTQKAFNLNGTLTVWNSALAAFSFAGFIRMSPEFFDVLSFGFKHSVCTMGSTKMVAGYWVHMFAMSKPVELIDTLFIVLRKRPLVFLHWYHHITVLIYTWHSFGDRSAAGQWFVWMNYGVHAFMYTYYMFRSAGFRIPKWISVTITTMQISQMFMGVIIAISAYSLKTRGVPCQQSYENLYFSFAIYFSYFLLFAQFFYCTYIGNRK